MKKLAWFIFLGIAIFVGLIWLDFDETPLMDKKVSGYALLGGAIYTVDDHNTVAQALVVEGKRIVYVGDKDGAAPFVKDGMLVIDTEGQMVLPGFIDTHSHVASSSYQDPELLIFDRGESIEVWLEQLRTHSEIYSNKKVVIGSGFTALKFGETGPQRFMLDDIESNRPVLLFDDGGHAMWVNSKAMELAGVNTEVLAENPEVTSFYHRDEHDQLTGWLRGAAAMDHLLARLPKELFMNAEQPKLTSEEYYEASKGLWAYMSSVGVTSVFDAHMGGQEAMFGNMLVELDHAGKLPFRLVGTHPVFAPDRLDTAIESLRNLQRNYNSERVRFSAIKLSLDGTIESRTAGLLAPYHHDNKNTGDKKFSRERLTEFIVQADAAGIDLYMHSIGDRSTRNALDAIAIARKVNKSEDKTRHTLSHLHMVDESDISRFAKLGVMAQTTPVWHARVSEYDDILGERSNRLFRFNSIANAGARLAFGSDYPVAGLGPLVPVFNIETGHTRQEVGNPNSTVLLPEHERMSVERLIKGYTRDAAYLLRLEDQIGSLEVGKLADIIVLNQNITTTPASDISSTVVTYTFVDGKMIHERTDWHDWQDIKMWILGAPPGF